MTTSSLARTATWLAAGRGMVGVVALALPVVLARTLTRSDYGLYKQVELGAVLVLPFLLMGFDKSVTFFVPRKERDAATEITSPFVALLGLATTLVLFAVLAPNAFGRLLGTAPIPLLAATAGTYAVASAVQMVGGRALVAVEEAKAAAVLPVVVGVPRVIVLIAVVLISPTLTAILWAILAFAIISVLAWSTLLAAKGCLRATFDRFVLVRHLRYGGMLALTSLINAWGVQLDNYLVASTLPPDMFAIYRVGRLRVPFLPILNRALVDAIAPRYSRLESLSRYKEMAALWKISVEILLPAGLLLSVFLASTAHWSIPFVYPHYEASVPIFRVFAFAILLESFGGIEQVLRALAALKFLLFSTIVALVMRVALGLLVLGHAPLWVLTSTQLLVTMLLILARVVFLQRRLDVTWSALIPGGAFVRTLPLLAIGLLATWAIDRFVDAQGWVCAFVAGIAWGLLVLWSLWRQERIRNLVRERLERGRARR